MIAKIKFETFSDVPCLALPYEIKVKFDEERAKTFAEYGDQDLLDFWCKRVLDLSYPEYQCKLISAEILTEDLVTK